MTATMRSGRSVGKSIEEAARGIGRHIESCQSNVHQFAESIDKLVTQRSDALVELAKHYLPEVNQSAIAGTFREIRDDLAGVLARKQRRERQLVQEIEKEATQTEQSQEALRQTTASLNELATRRESLEKQVVQRLEVHNKFQRLSREALAAEQELSRNEARVEEIGQEAKEKLPSYEKSRFFRYLKDRGYGTSEYKKTGWTKRWDRWVAKLIDYPRARRSYDFLRVTPELMSQEVVRRREQFNVLMEQVEAIEDQIADEVGLTEVMRQGQQLGAERDAFIAELDRRRETSEALHKQLLKLDGNQNEFYDQAIDRLKQFLASMEASHLEYRSRATPEREDDEIVAEMSWLNEQLEEAKRESASFAAEQRIWEQRGEGLQILLTRFRRADFDAGRSTFATSFDVERQLERYLRGEIDHETLWSRLRLNQHFAPPWYEETGRDMGDIIDNDFSYVLLRVLAEVAGHALRHAAYRGMQRRSPLRKLRRKKEGRPRFINRGFTRGRGF